VKKSALTLALGALGVALAVAGGAMARSEATRIQLTAALDAAQEVPAASGDVGGARGTFTATVTGSGAGATLVWRLTFSGLTGDAGAAHIHVAARGEAGPAASSRRP
jgi:hypothetical protein